MKAPIFPQVTKAVNQMLDLILNSLDEFFFLLIASMQSGKTQFIEDMHIALREHFPNCMGLYVVSHNHTDFIMQNFSRLEHLEAVDFYCLSLRERRIGSIKKRPLKSFNNDPLFIYWDESHHGDAVMQSIDVWLKQNNLYPQKKVYLIGVSATPFSSLARAKDTAVIYDKNLMPKYKSVTIMLERGDIEEATPIVKSTKNKVEIIETAPAYQYIEKIIQTKNSGYIIIRLAKDQHGVALNKHLTKRFGKRIHVRFWDQNNQLDNPNDYFSTYRKDVVTVVIVKQKARMGNTIPTQFVHMVYEYSPSASVATIAQGLLGRVCGHNKLDHQLRIYTHLKQAQAYSLFEQGKFEEFYSFMETNGVKASLRTSLTTTSGRNVITEVTTSETSDAKTVKQNIKKYLTEKFGEKEVFNDFTVNTLSENKFEGYWYKEIIDAPLSEVSRKKLVRKPNAVSILIDDRKSPCSIYSTFEDGEYCPQTNLVPKSSSIYSVI